MTKGPVIAVIGAGFTGTLTALHLLRDGPPRARIHLIEKSPGFGRGLAYGAHNPQHLLNVRVGNMSAYPDDPDHLRRWLAARPGAVVCASEDFITRGVYGDYLAAQLQNAIRQPDGAERLVLVADQALDLEMTARGGTVSLAMGRSLEIDAAILAVGNLPPLSPPGLGLEALGSEFYAPHPWAGGALKGIEPRAPVLLIGSGLTMVDIALLLVARGHEGRITALSRRGLVPHRHTATLHRTGAPDLTPGAALSALLADRRRRSGEVGWRAAVDELRPVTTDLWRGADEAQRRRFLRHLRPWWDIHRHRMAPGVADRIEAMVAARRLQVEAGRLVKVRAGEGEARVQWRLRGCEAPEEHCFARIINCTGMGADLTRAEDPLLRRLLAKGVIRADPLGLGLEVDGASRVLGSAGAVHANLYAAGPITQGYSWEAVAVPDIRNQVAALAATLSERRLTLA